MQDVRALGVCRYDRWDMDFRILSYIVVAGFYPWTLVSNSLVNHGLLAVLVERWRSKTRSFTLCPGEIIIRLQDAEVLIGLPVDGLLIIALKDVTNQDDHCIKLLGAVAERGNTHTIMRWTWLQGNMSVVLVDANEEMVRQYARAYILGMLGCTLMPDNSASEVSLHYLPLLENLDQVIKYSQGGAILAQLYPQLCIACQANAV